MSRRAPGPKAGPRFGGVFFEDVNHSGEGGRPVRELVGNGGPMAAGGPR